MSKILIREPGLVPSDDVRNSDRSTPGIIRRAVPAVASLLLLVLLHHDLPSRLEYPPGMDQDLYLASGRDLVEYFGFQPRAPVYGAWVGLNYLGAGLNQERCFYLEKFTNILLLAVLTSYVFYVLSDLRTSFFMTFWLLNCKYLIYESNGSHSFATSLALASILCLHLCGPAARLPCALLVLYLSALVRPEMQIVFLALSVSLLLFALRSPKPGGIFSHKDQFGRPGHWVAAVALGLVLTVGMLIRPGHTPSNNPHEKAFLDNFAVTYIDRNHLRQRFPHRWDHCREIFAEVLPGVEGTLDAVRKYPGEVLRHMAYNAMVSARALPAMALGLINPGWVLLSAVFWILSYFLEFVHGISFAQFRKAGKRLPRDQLALVVLWIAAIALIVPICVFIGVQARFYVIMIPVIQLITFFVIKISLRLMTVNCLRLS